MDILASCSFVTLAGAVSLLSACYGVPGTAQTRYRYPGYTSPYTGRYTAAPSVTQARYTALGSRANQHAGQARLSGYL